MDFSGFDTHAFEALARLKATPTVEQLRRDREAIRRHVQQPFAAYRDELVLRWVIPERLDLETERGVFSRLPKNDFGAGGAHHHLWMSFFRPGYRRLTDVQRSHGLYPDGFAFGLYVGAYAKTLFRAVLRRFEEDPEEALALLNDRLATGYTFSFARTVTKRETTQSFAAPLAALPEDLSRARGLWLSRRLDRERVLALGPGLVEEGIAAQHELEALYRWMIEADAS